MDEQGKFNDIGIEMEGTTGVGDEVDITTTNKAGSQN